MDQKIALLAGICAVSERDQVSSDVVRDLRNILSLFKGQIIPEDDYQELIQELQDEHYLRESPDGLVPTREGLALSQSIFGRLVGETSFETFSRMIDDYQREPKSYLRKVSENIRSLQDQHEKKISDESVGQAHAIGFLLEIEHEVSRLFVNCVEINHDLLRDDDALTKEINTSTNRYSKNTGFPLITRRKNNSELELISLHRINSFKLFADELSISHTEEIDRHKVPGWNKALTLIFLEDALKRLGYIRSQWPGRNFVNFNDYKIIETNLGQVRECPAIEVDIQELKEDKLFVWLQTYVSPAKRLIDYMNENLLNRTQEELLRTFAALKLRSIPSGSELSVKNVLLDRDMTHERIPDMRLTYSQFWKETYGVTLTERQHIIVVGGRGVDYHYPAEMIYVDRYSLEKVEKESVERKTRAESPRQRASKCLEFFHGIKNHREKRWTQVRIKIIKCNPTLEELQKGGAVERVLRVHQPMLEFRSGAVSLDPLDIFKGDYGAKCGQKAISLSHLLVPKTIDDAQIGLFVRGLQKAFSSIGFGSITRSTKTVIARFDENHKADLERNIRSLDRIQSKSNQLGIIVIPDGHSELYFTAKRLFPTRVGVPVQMVRLSSFKEITDDKFRGFKLLCLKILIKSLKRGESVWTLSHNAGLLPKRTLYIGIGYSAFPREGKSSKCATVLHDARGNKVSWKVFATIQTRTINKQWFDTLLHHIREIVDSEKPERLVFYRTGTMFPVELEAVRSSLDSCEWVQSIERCFVSILEGANHRFFLANNYRNLPAGYSVLLDANEGLISSSNFDDRDLRQGTVSPVRLKLEIGNESILDIIKEYHDLTYLNWLAPYTTAKHPLVITIAERFAELTRENIPAENMFYLDL